MTMKPIGLVLLSLLAAAAVHAASLKWLDVALVPGWSGPGSQASGPTQEIFNSIHTQAEWAALWQTLETTRIGRQKAPPPVDLSKHTMIVAALGTRRTGGYSVLIQYVLDDGTAVHVSLLEVRPGPTCTVATTLTYPITLALIPRTDRPVKFEREFADLDCNAARHAG